ncbi:MAG TPA: methyl-accepting chemotaxis protein, partial [Desulfobacteraceae bacterium]|nr:methyl-accepting chemotaxis protein [Desulfobacteraceae bacterium]
MLEGTIKKIHEGENLVSGANKSFKGVTTIAQKIGELAGEIASASQGQATGIDQLNKAVSEMEKIIQQTAASVQESSGVSEEMKAQAEQMKVFIKHLAEMVEG